ncbi:MAG TPA: LCP family protein, partial [Thermobifida alba]|nr:LCP family protein [Thermobifida alba]
MSDDAPTPAASSTDSPPPRRRSRRRVVVWTSLCLAAALIACLGTAYVYYRSLRANMVHHDLTALLPEEERPPKIGDAVNILFIGSDGREGGNAAYGGRDFVGERSDSLLLAHISPDNGVIVVSFPRDSLVNLPDCDPYGETEGTYGYYGMINAALFHGGPPCVVKTIESLTQIRVDHFVHLSFVGFREMVDSIGGVEM